MTAALRFTQMFLLLFTFEASAESLREVFWSCKPPSEKAMSCFTENRVMCTGCSINTGWATCTPEDATKLLPIKSNCTYTLSFDYTSDSIEVEFQSKSQKVETCTFDGLEVEVSPHTTNFDVGHATRSSDRKKWLATPPVIPIGLRTHIKPQDIVVTSVQSRHKFFLGYGTFFERDRGACDNHDTVHHFSTSFSEDEVDYEPDEKGILQTIQKRVPDAKKEKATLEAIAALGLERTEDFLRLDRHIIGRNRNFNYSVVSSFKPKKDLNICGHTVPKGTELRLSTKGPKGKVCTAAVDGVLYILGIPNVKKIKADDQKEPTKTLSCVPKAFRAAIFNEIWGGLLDKPGSKPPKKPVLDFNDCDCEAREVQIEKSGD